MLLCSELQETEICMQEPTTEPEGLEAVTDSVQTTRQVLEEGGDAAAT